MAGHVQEVVWSGKVRTANPMAQLKTELCGSRACRKAEAGIR